MAPVPPVPVAPVAPVAPATPLTPVLFQTVAFSPFLQLLPRGMKRTALVFLLTQPLICPLVVARRACLCTTAADARLAPAITATTVKMTRGDTQLRRLLCTYNPFRGRTTPLNDRQQLGYASSMNGGCGATKHIGGASRRDYRLPHMRDAETLDGAFAPGRRRPHHHSPRMAARPTSQSSR